MPSVKNFRLSPTQFLLLLLLGFPAGSCIWAQSLDSFSPGVNSTITITAPQPDGSILVSGNSSALGGLPMSYIGRINSAGVGDPSFQPGPDLAVTCLAVQTDGKIVVGGSFTSIAGEQHVRIARLNPDGTVDPDFNPSANAGVLGMAIQQDGKILVGGYFTNLTGQTALHIGRLNIDGSLDTNFVGAVEGFLPGFNVTQVTSILPLPDGKILVGGLFGTLSGQPHSCFGRLNPDGSSDETFSSDADGGVEALVDQPDGKILVGGGFTILGGGSCSRIGRVDTLGALDPSFAPGANSPVYSFALQTDGRLLLGGSFTTLANQSISRIARIDAAGNADPSFSASASATVFSVVLQSDGNILAAGAFTTLDGQSVPYFGRLVNTEPATTSLNVEGNTITWLRGGTCPEVSWTTFESSQDGSNWTSLGFGNRIKGGWQSTGVHPPATGLVRARGRVSGGAYLSGSSWLVESVIQIGSAIPLSILVNDGNLGFASNNFGFNITGTAGQSMIIEASSDLANWIPITTNFLSTAPLYFSDQTPKTVQRFYRARLPKP